MDPADHAVWRDAVACNQRLEAELCRLAPRLAQHVMAWLRRIYGPDPATAWIRPRAFPLLQLPRWLATSLDGVADAAFQADLDYSSVNGYYLIRLIDNVMDGDGAGEAKLLPTVTFFHSRFQGVYLRSFPAGHAFWQAFDATWTEYADQTVRDGFLQEVGEREFREIAGKKFCAAKIPLTAVALRSERIEALPLWHALVEALGRWHQMANDFFGWHHDREYRIPTFVQTSADRMRLTGESPASWFAREGFDWGVAELEKLRQEVREAASAIASPELHRYLAGREVAFKTELETAAQAVQALRALEAVFA
jgi:hypothetical protein